MDQYIATAMSRILTLTDIKEMAHEDVQSVRDFCDAFSKRVAVRYLQDDLSWEQGDAVMNHLFNLMISHSGNRVPDFAWEVYLAFDAGEYMEPGGDATTRPLINKLQGDA